MKGEEALPSHRVAVRSSDLAALRLALEVLLCGALGGG